MDRAQEIVLNSDITKNTVKFLSKICQLDCLNVPALKSYYGTRVRVVTAREHMLSPQNLKKTPTTCSKCLLQSKDSPPKFRIVPQKKLTKFGKKLKKKRLKERPLTKYQKEYWKRLKYRPWNYLEMFCKICENKSFIKLPHSRLLIKQTEPTPSKGKRKKKKDKFCGLNQKAVLSVSSKIAKRVEKRKLIMKKKPKKSLPLTTVSPREVAKKKKTFDKMSELFNNSAEASNTSSTGLQDFLQSL